MAESVTYQGRRVALRIPEAQAFEAQAIERGQATLQRSLDRMTNFFAEQNRIVAKIEGQEYGAANAPTMEQILAARQTGEELELPGDKNSLFGRAARQAAATVVSSELELAAHKEMNAAILDFKEREANPAGLQDKLDAIILGYSSTFDETVPSMARSLKSKLALNAQTKYANYHSAYITNQQEKSRAAWLANSNLEFDNFPNLFRVGIVEKDKQGNEVTRPVTPKDIAMYKFNKLNEMKNLNFSESQINSWSTGFDAQVLASARANLSDTVLATAKPHQIIRKIQASDLKGLPENITVPIAILQDGDVSLNDIARQLRTGLSEEINFENKLEENRNKNTEANEEIFTSRANRAMLIGDTEEFKTAIELLRRTNNEKADELEEKFLEAGMRRTISDPKVQNFLIDKGDNLTIDHVASVANLLSNDDRVKFTNKADEVQNVETKEAISIMRGRFLLPPGYEPVSDKDPNFKKATAFARLVGRLTDKVQEARRQGKDIDATAEVNLLIAEMGQEFDDILNELIIKSAKEALEKYITTTEQDLSELSSGLSYLKGLRSKVISDGKEAYPAILRRGKGLTQADIIKKLTREIAAIEKAIGE
tara:strand:+ start:4585 stop:6375 length:1791 start_codon:yes stop_codon:yes gene_type:complete